VENISITSFSEKGRLFQAIATDMGDWHKAAHSAAR
jgi:hypothetical protein